MSSIEASIVYFKKPGEGNTDEVLRLARRRADELGLKTAVVASVRGYTAVKAMDVFQGRSVLLPRNKIQRIKGNHGIETSRGEIDRCRISMNKVTSRNALAGEIGLLLRDIDPCDRVLLADLDVCRIT